MERGTSWEVRVDDWNTRVQAASVPAWIAVEFREKPIKGYNPFKRKPPQSISDVEYDPTTEDLRHRKSFIRARLSQNEIRERLVFLDAEFTARNADDSRSPLTIAAINYDGKILMDAKITPRQRVIDFGEKYHGIRERHTRNCRDE